MTLIDLLTSKRFSIQCLGLLQNVQTKRNKIYTDGRKDDKTAIYPSQQRDDGPFQTVDETILLRMK